MNLRHTTLNAKKSVLCLIACLLGSPAVAQDAPAEKATSQPSTEDRFEVRNLEGWTLYINRDVPKQYPEQTAKTLEHLGWELYQIKLAAPALAVRNMQEQNAIWIEYQEEVDLSYHPERSWLIDRGYTIPRDPQSFMSLSVKTHVGDSYANLFLSEFTLATGEKTAFSELEQTTLRGVKNQCMNGMWGHAPSLADGYSEGYGGMNVIGLPMTISLVLARQAGVSDPALDKAIDKSAKFLRYYVDKGAIPYGDHPAWGNAHDDNGKSSCAAVLFDLLGDREATAFNSWMATAAYDHREQGHCGNFWNMLWAIPGASRSGPLATGAYLKEQAWYYDLSRNWKGGFVYQKIEAGEENDNYTDWDLTGAYLLSFGLYHKSLYILGKKPSAAPALNAEAVQKVIAAGRDRFPEGERSGYYKRNDEELLEGLKSWSWPPSK